MKITYDEEAGAWYFKLRDEKVDETVVLQDGFAMGIDRHINVDKNKKGEIIGIEYLDLEEDKNEKEN